MINELDFFFNRCRIENFIQFLSDDSIKDRYKIYLSKLITENINYYLNFLLLKLFLDINICHLRNCTL